jgi:hypothetical protein
MTEPFWLAQHDITKEKVTQRDGQTPYETNKEREREQRHKMKAITILLFEDSIH